MIRFCFTIIISLLIFSCEKSSEPINTSIPQITDVKQKPLSSPTESTSDNLFKSKVTPNAEPIPASDFITAEWLDLIPENDLNALLNPPDYIDDIAENSQEDQLNAQFKNKTNSQSDDPYQQALMSTQVISALNNVPVRIPTFIVPLEFDDNQRVTQFFMVPYFGACIHEPPPPPNQTIFVNYPQGFKLESLTEPYWISGILKTSLVENDMAIAAYSMEVKIFEPYTDE